MNTIWNDQCRTVWAAFFTVSIIAASGCATAPTRDTVRQQPVLADTVYLANNIHAQDDVQHLSASYANWTDMERHRLIPVNSRVTIHDWRGGLAIRVLDADVPPVIMEYNADWMRLTKEEYIEEITVAEPLDLDHLSGIDREGIEDGEAKTGMSKEGTRIALGYPARHTTPSLEDDEWTYWRNRWIRYMVVFDEDGKVKDIVD